jgi:hypothetical protein
MNPETAFLLEIGMVGAVIGALINVMSLWVLHIMPVVMFVLTP